MALNGTTLYVAVETFTTTIGGLTKTVKKGDVLLGSKLPAGAEPLVIEFGSTPAEISARRVAAGLPPSSGE
jgi:hypothetical protein